MIRYACERGTYIIANRVLNAKPKEAPKYNLLQYLMYTPKPQQPPPLKLKKHVLKKTN